MSLTDRQRPLVQHISSLVGSKVAVAQYRDEDDVETVAVCVAEDWPEDGTTTCATVGASDTEVRDGWGVEFIASGPSGREEVGELLATVATFVLREGWEAVPGVVFEDVGLVAIPGTSLPHVLLVEPGPFQQLGLTPLTTDRRQVAYLMPVLISDGELEVLMDEGPEALEELLQRAGADVQDLDRPSVA